MSPLTSDLGIANPKRIADAMVVCLANTYLLLLKTQYFHWNVTGPSFYPLHKLFEDQYTELQEAVDTLAERVRKLGYPAPGSFSHFLSLAKLSEAEGTLKAIEMVKILQQDHETLLRMIRGFIEIAQKERDEASADIWVSRLHAHEKAAWMLRATGA